MHKRNNANAIILNMVIIEPNLSKAINIGSIFDLEDFCIEQNHGVGAAAGAAWKLVSNSHKQAFTVLAKTDRLRYNKELEEREQLLIELDQEDADNKIALELKEDQLMVGVFHCHTQNKKHLHLQHIDRYHNLNI